MQNKDAVVSQKPHRRGIATIYFLLAFVVLVGFVSFATDYAHVQLAKTQLETATDAACRYSTHYAANGQAAVLSKASAAAAENQINGKPLALQSADVKVGNWNAASKTFTNGGMPVNAVKVTAECSSARSSAIPLLFGAIIGRSTCDIHAICVSSYVNYGGLQGLNGITFKNNTNVYGYDPNVL